MKTTIAESVLESKEPVSQPYRSPILASRENDSNMQAELRYLNSDDASAWDALVDVSPQGSPFTRSWWLGAVGGTVQILGYFKGRQLTGGMPLYSESRYGIRIFTMPKLTQTLGPVLLPPNSRKVTSTCEEMECLTAFAKELAKNTIVFEAFHPTLQNWTPFYWNGFSQTSRATQIIDVSVPSDKLWDNLSHDARRRIRKATRMEVKIVPCDSDEVWRAEARSFGRQKMQVSHSLEYLRGLYLAARQNQAGECFSAIDSGGRVHCACFVVWDHKRAYAVAAGGDPELRSSGAMSLLMWHIIEFVSHRTRVLDFAGSMLQPVELFQRSFGTTPVPYMWIMKLPLWMKMYLHMRHKF